MVRRRADTRKIENSMHTFAIRLTEFSAEACVFFSSLYSSFSSLPFVLSIVGIEYEMNWVVVLLATD